MRAIFNSLSFRIGGLIVLIELITLAIAGVVYLNNFSAQVDSRLESALSLPGNLMNAGLLDFEAVNDLETMREIVGEDVRTALVVATNNMVFFSSNADYLGREVHTLEGIDVAAFDRSMAAVAPELSTSGEVLSYVSPIYGPDGRTPRFYSYVEVGSSEAVAQKSLIGQTFVVGTVATVVVTSLIIFLSFNIIVLRRIFDVVRTSKRVEEGDLSARVTVRKTKDEITELQLGVNAMVARLQNLVGTLEDRVAQGTRDLQVAADVSVQISTQLDTSQLLADVVERTAKAFNLYHVSIFQYDEKTQILRLKQGVGEPGQQMVLNGKQLMLNDRGIVPSAALSRKPALSNNVLDDPNHARNPLLPETRAELAIPMLYRGNLLGVLDLQSEQANRFKDEDIRILQTLADQIAVAVRNSQLFEEVKTARVEAERANKVKSLFLASMSHELRTPLNSIINFSEFIVRGVMGPISDRQRDTLKNVVSSGEHLLALINDILDISKIESGSLNLFIEDDVEIAAIVTSAANTANSLLKDRPVDLVVDVQPDLPRITGDRQRILQVLLNIVSNACKFTDEGSVKIGAHLKDDEIIWYVADTGPGISEEDYPLVFEKFAQTDSGLRRGGGTGLGMAISKSLVESHGGRIWIESVVEKGTTFYFTLPVARSVVEER